MAIKSKVKLVSVNDKNSNTAIGDVFRRQIASPEQIEQTKEMIKNPEPISPVSKALMKSDSDVDNTLEKFNIAKPSEEIIVPRRLLDPAPNEWNFFGRPDPDSYKILMNSIIVEGLMNPITLWARPDGRYMILSGHTRESVFDLLYQATLDSKWQEIPAKVYGVNDINENDARRIIITANLAQRAKESPRLRVKSIGELVKLTRESIAWGSGIDINKIVAEAFGIKRTQAFLYMKLKRLIPSILDKYCEGKISGKAAAEICNLPPVLQTYLLSQGYIERIKSVAQAKLIGKCKTKEEIDNVFAAGVVKPDKPQKVSVQLNVEKRDGEKVLPVCIGDREYADVCKTFIAAIENSGFSQEVKDRILYQLNNSF